METAPKSDLPQGTLDLLILRVVAQGPIHGYAISQKILQVSREALQVNRARLPGPASAGIQELFAAEWAESESAGTLSFTGSLPQVELT
jgi:PadR family transcriptional regulator, regulatory protein PadR